MLEPPCTGGARTLMLPCAHDQLASLPNEIHDQIPMTGRIEPHLRNHVVIYRRTSSVGNLTRNRRTPPRIGNGT